MTFWMICEIPCEPPIPNWALLQPLPLVWGVTVLILGSTGFWLWGKSSCPRPANTQLLPVLRIGKSLSSLNCPCSRSSLKRRLLLRAYSFDCDLMLFNSTSFRILISSSKYVKPKRKKFTGKGGCQSAFFRGFYSWICLTSFRCCYVNLGRAQMLAVESLSSCTCVRFGTWYSALHEEQLLVRLILTSVFS